MNRRLTKRLQQRFRKQFIAGLEAFAWIAVPFAITVIATRALITKYPEVDVVWLFLAAGLPVVAIQYACAKLRSSLRAKK